MTQLCASRFCGEHSCSVMLLGLQGLRNVRAGTQAGPGLPAVAPSPADLSPAWLCTPKTWQDSKQQLQCPCPIRPVGLLVPGSTVVQGTGKGPWGECAGCFLSLPQDHQQLGMWGARLRGPFALLCSFPCY